MAAPFVTGTAALLLGINPNYTWRELRIRILNMVDIDSRYSGIVATHGALNILQSVLVSLGYAGVGDVDMNGTITAATTVEKGNSLSFSVVYAFTISEEEFTSKTYSFLKGNDFTLIANV